MRSAPGYTGKCSIWSRGQITVALLDVRISEHHGVADGHPPAPLIAGAAIAAQTDRLRIAIAALVLTLHDPIVVAEQVAVLDHLSNGRLDLMLAAGYVPSELKMFGIDPKERGSLMEDKIREPTRLPGRGEQFLYHGRLIRVTPVPLQHPHPPLYLGGSTAAAARRAARLSMGFDTHLTDLYELYANEARKIGFEPNPLFKLGRASCT